MNDLLIKDFGKPIAPYLTVTFHTVDEKDVCKIAIVPAPEATYVTLKIPRPDKRMNTYSSAQATPLTNLKNLVKSQNILNSDGVEQQILNAIDQPIQWRQTVANSPAPTCESVTPHSASSVQSETLPKQPQQ